MCVDTPGSLESACSGSQHNHNRLLLFVRPTPRRYPESGWTQTFLTDAYLATPMRCPETDEYRRDRLLAWVCFADAWASLFFRKTHHEKQQRAGRCWCVVAFCLSLSKNPIYLATTTRRQRLVLIDPSMHQNLCRLCALASLHAKDVREAIIETFCAGIRHGVMKRLHHRLSGFSGGTLFN